MTNNTEIVRLNNDGTVSWANGINVDAAAEAFSQSIILSTEMKANITQKVKEELKIDIIKELCAFIKENDINNKDELIYYLESAIIMDTLKGRKTL